MAWVGFSYNSPSTRTDLQTKKAGLQIVVPQCPRKPRRMRFTNAWPSSTRAEPSEVSLAMVSVVTSLFTPVQSGPSMALVAVPFCSLVVHRCKSQSRTCDSTHERTHREKLQSNGKASLKTNSSLASACRPQELGFHPALAGGHVPFRSGEGGYLIA